MAEHRGDQRNSNSQLLLELESLSQSMYQSHTARRTASLALPRSATPVSDAISSAVADEPRTGEHRPRSRRLSMSPWRSRPGHRQEPEQTNKDNQYPSQTPARNQQLTAATVVSQQSERKGIWNWKPMRALSHIRMQRIGCLLSIEVVAVQNLPASMNGLRLCVAVRKKETKDGAVQTMPARVLQGAADFEETMFIRCHVYCTGGAGKPLKFEPRLFLISAFAVDAPELDFGKNTVDLSQLVTESMERSVEGVRVKQWEVNFELAGKAKGGELLVKLGFQIMEDGGVGIYSHRVEETKSSSKNSKTAIARKQSKSSFSVSSPRITKLEPCSTPAKETALVDLKDLDDFSLDESSPPPATVNDPSEKEQNNNEDLELLEFEIIDKGIEIQSKTQQPQEEKEKEEAGEEAKEVKSESSEEVKEVVHDGGHLLRLSELDEIVIQIKALESLIGGESEDFKITQEKDEDEEQRLDAEEETVTREFLQLLEIEDAGNTSSSKQFKASDWKPGDGNSEAKTFISDLGKGLGCIVQTRDGGFLASLNPFDVEVPRKQIPKLALQISKPFVLQDCEHFSNGFEVFQRLAAIGVEELGTQLLLLASMDELMGKTAEQIAFEGIASAIITGRSKELGASSSAAKSVLVLKKMSAAMNDGRRERIATGLWNVNKEPVAVEEVLAFSLQKLESMAVEALKVQAGLAEEEAPFDISPVKARGQDTNKSILDAVASLESFIGSASSVLMMLVLVQLRDPMRRYEAVGGPMIALLHATKASASSEEKFNVSSLHVGGLKLKTAEKQRLTAMQWLVAYGLVKGLGKKTSAGRVKMVGQESIWSLSSRIMADMWLKPTRNPDVKLQEN